MLIDIFVIWGLAAKAMHTTLPPLSTLPEQQQPPDTSVQSPRLGTARASDAQVVRPVGSA